MCSDTPVAGSLDRELFDAVVNSNEALYEAVRDRVQAVWDGYNASIIAFGPTGSGKTSSLTGGGMGRQHHRDDWHRMGVLPRAIAELRRRLRHDWMRCNDSSSSMPHQTASDTGIGQGSALVSARMYLTAGWIVNERFVDLLAAPRVHTPGTSTDGLGPPQFKVDAFRPYGEPHGTGMISPARWSSYPLSQANHTAGELLASSLTQLILLTLCDASDQTADGDDDDDALVAVNAVRCAMRDYLERATSMGCPYSRSTVVYMVYVERCYRMVRPTDGGCHDVSTLKTLNFLRIVDLCGCEPRSAAIDAATSDTPVSLQGLELVLRFLAQGAKHIPFRGSSLTMILRDALMGTGWVTLICCQREVGVDESRESITARGNVKAVRLVRAWLRSALRQQATPLQWPVVQTVTAL